jgi:hypothetical protein
LDKLSQVDKRGHTTSLDRLPTNQPKKDMFAMDYASVMWGGLSKEEERKVQTELVDIGRPTEDSDNSNHSPQKEDDESAIISEPNVEPTVDEVPEKDSGPRPIRMSSAWLQFKLMMWKHYLTKTRDVAQVRCFFCIEYLSSYLSPLPPPNIPSLGCDDFRRAAHCVRVHVAREAQAL